MSAGEPTFPTAAPWPGTWATLAACAGAWTLMDEALPGESDEEREARYWRAAGLCRGCRVLAECEAWRLATPRRQRVGVIAGHVRMPGRRLETDLLNPASTAVAVA